MQPKRSSLLILASLFFLFHETTSSKILYENIKSVFDHFSAKLKFDFIDPWITFTTGPRTYDFIVVGGGSAGSVIANRLTENPSWNVLLLEAGKTEPLISRVPLIAQVLQYTPYNWRYYTEPQQNVGTGLINQRVHWPRGRALGGSSVINYMMYTRGNRYDFDKWEAQGNPGWSYDDVLPYYLKSERARLEVGDMRYHSTNGSLSVENIYESKLVDAFIESGKELNLPNIDYNANIDSLGLSRIQGTVLRGERHTVARAFLFPIKKRKNLHVLTGAHATKILINPNTLEAYGVEYRKCGLKHRVYATKEVVASAGVINSAQLLMLSGIGPKEHLSDLGIILLKNAAVGQNLHDHVAFPGLIYLIDKPLSVSLYDGLNPKNYFDFAVKGKGKFTSLGGVEGIGYIKTTMSDETLDIPDIELVFTGATIATDHGITSGAMRISKTVSKTMLKPIQDKPQWSILPLILHPKSRGYLKLKSKNPFKHPLLYGNYFTDPEDQDINTLLAGIRYIQTIAKTKPFQRLGSRLNPHRIPGCGNYTFDSDDYWKCALRSIGVTFYHQAGTAKMGPSNDTNAVVNHELKVYGIKKLRVADCSVIPFPLGAHTNAPAIMIGEKASDMIKDEWGAL